MIECVACREWIDLDLDGLLDTNSATDLNAHLQSCAACRRYEQAQRALSLDLASLALAADDLAAGNRHEARRAPNWMGITSRAAAVGLVIAGTWMFVRHPSSIPPAHRSSRTTGLSEDAQSAPPTRFAASVELSPSNAGFVVPIETDNPRVHVVWLYDVPSSAQEAAPSSSPSS